MKGCASEGWRRRRRRRRRCGARWIGRRSRTQSAVHLSVRRLDCSLLQSCSSPGRNRSASKLKRRHQKVMRLLLYHPKNAELGAREGFFNYSFKKFTGVFLCLEQQGSKFTDCNCNLVWYRNSRNLSSEFRHGCPEANQIKVTNKIRCDYSAVYVFTGGRKASRPAGTTCNVITEIKPVEEVWNPTNRTPGSTQRMR